MQLLGIHALRIVELEPLTVEAAGEPGGFPSGLARLHSLLEQANHLAVQLLRLPIGPLAHVKEPGAGRVHDAVAVPPPELGAVPPLIFRVGLPLEALEFFSIRHIFLSFQGTDGLADVRDQDIHPFPFGD